MIVSYQHCPSQIPTEPWQVGTGSTSSSIRQVELCPSPGQLKPRRYGQPGEKDGGSSMSFLVSESLTMLTGEDFKGLGVRFTRPGGCCSAPYRRLTARCHEYTIGDKATRAG